MQILNLSATLNVASLEPSINTYRLGEGAGTYEYPELNNKPQINGVTLVGNISSANLGIKTSDLTNDSGYISEADIPTATSDLVNDSGFVNGTQVQSIVSDAIPSDISYFNNDVGYITNADIGNIPTRTSQLVNDSGYITAAEAPVVSVNNMTGAVVLDGSNIEYEQNLSLNSKIDAVEADIPTATSQLVNDSGFITNANIPTKTSQLVNDSGFVNAQNIPVQSVNAKTGAVELTATDIDYDSDNTVAAKIDAVEGSIPTQTSQLTNDSGFISSDSNNPLFKSRKTEAITKTIAANGWSYLLGSDLNIAEPGYTPIGVSQLYCSNTNVVLTSYNCTYVSGSTAFGIARNLATTDQNVTFQITVLFMRNDAF